MNRSLTKTCFKFFRILGNPTRLAILELLTKNPLTVKEICEQINQERSMVAHNLHLLLSCGFVSVERRGKTRVYMLNEIIMEDIFRIFKNHYEKNCPLAHAPSDCGKVKSLKI